MSPNFILLATAACCVALARPADAQCNDVAWPAPASQPGSGFGATVALQGERALVGAHQETKDHFHEGAAYVYQRSFGSWQLVTRLSGHDTVSGDEFGRALALAGDVIVVGATLHGPGGAAYVFEWNGSDWLETAKLVGSDVFAGELFGDSITAARDTIVVSARGHDGFRGAAYIFGRSGNSWSELQKLEASDGVAGDTFGVKIAMRDDVLLVGAANADGHGAVYRFERSAGSWTEAEKWQLALPQPGDWFGISIAVGRDIALLGTRRDAGAGPLSGAVFVFERSGSAWSEVDMWTASDGASGDSFGRSVAISGERALVGAMGDDCPGVDAGAAYLFERSQGSWVETAKLQAAGSESNDYFGRAVALWRDVALVGSGSPAIHVSDTAYLFDPVAACSSFGTVFCDPATPNSSGFAAEISVEGTDVVATNALVLVATHLPPQRFGMFLMSLNTGSSVPPTSQGTLCLGGNIIRFRNYIRRSSAIGELCMTVDLTQLPSSISPAVLAGETWHFQCWYRDTQTPATSNLTNALSIPFH